VPVLIGHIIFGDKKDIAVAFVLDLSEQKRTERELKRRDQEFRMLADHMSQLAWMADESGAITWYNRRWLDYTGTTIEQMQRSGWQGVVHPDHVEHVFRKITQCYKTGEPWEETFPLRGKSGSWRWFLSRAVPIRDAQGKINRWFGTCTDVTEQREMEQELKEANRRKDEFLATLAHELRNPLAPISSGLTLMKLSSPDSTAASKARDIMDRQLAHMVRLIDDLLDVSRISRGKLELRRERVSVQMIVDSAVEVSKPLIEDDEHALTVSLPPQPLHIDADPVRIAQVISNLLNNAAKYTPQGGSIGLFAQQEGSAVVIRVKDSGIGITPEALPRVFEMFTQVNRTVERAKGGLGIGLSVAKQLVELHGGILTAQSDGAGLGSTFTVWLPLAESIRKTQAMPSESSRLPALESKRILVVDDNEDAAETLVMLLELNGHKMRTAHNGPDALRIARDFKPDLVFLDIGLPGMNGYEVAERVRAEPDLSHTVLVALTGWGSEEDKRRSTKAGFDFHLTKPVMAASLDIIFAQLV
jgi:PAS domain S-box-containing protein